MSNSLSKKEFVHKLSSKMQCDEKRAGEWLDAVTNTLYETFRDGSGVSITGFGGFYLDRRGDSCAFKFNPGQKLRALLGWSSTYKGEL
ncbi:MAG: HU family DNA-binding protein [Desulfobacterales bacterium]|nr:HU family DNA-binding protein [Desulfobacterales bacterium]